MKKNVLLSGIGIELEKAFDFDWKEVEIPLESAFVFQLGVFNSTLQLRPKNCKVAFKADVKYMIRFTPKIWFIRIMNPCAL